jgi:hypothetical protein
MLKINNQFPQFSLNGVVLPNITLYKLGVVARIPDYTEQGMKFMLQR